MKITKAMLNRECRVTWRDPGQAKAPIAETQDRKKLPKGIPALAKWIERGYFDDVTDGVARLIQSEVWTPGDEETELPNEAAATWMPEDLIKKVEFFDIKEVAE